jgi:DNA polymerase III alpha subunit (gram-positive type)
MIYSFMDFETTGLDYTKDQIIQYGIVRTDFNGYEERITGNVKLEEGNILPSKIIELTGLTKKDLDGGVPLDFAKELIEKFIEGTIVVAHHASFDLGFIKEIDVPEFYCTRTIALMVLPNEPSHSLSDLCKKFDIMVNYKQHDALSDALACKELFTLFKNKLGKGLPIYKNKLLGTDKRPLRYIPNNAVLIK